jgi:hypothetical protein
MRTDSTRRSKRWATDISRVSLARELCRLAQAALAPGLFRLWFIANATQAVFRSGSPPAVNDWRLRGQNHDARIMVVIGSSAVALCRSTVLHFLQRSGWPLETVVVRLSEPDGVVAPERAPSFP